MALLLAILLIVPKAVIDGLQLRGNKTLAGVIEFIYLAYTTLIALAWLYGMCPTDPLKDYFWVTLVGFVLLRYGIFSIIFNLIVGLKLSYIGNTKVFDIIGSYFVDRLKVSDTLIIFSKAIATLWGIAWLLGWRNGIIL